MNQNSFKISYIENHKKALISVIISIIAHLLLALIFILLVQLHKITKEQQAKKEQFIKFIIPKFKIEKVEKEIPKKEILKKKKINFVDVDEKTIEQNETKDADFISYANTQAQSVLKGDINSLSPSPTQEGIKQKGLQLYNSKFSPEVLSNKSSFSNQKSAKKTLPKTSKDKITKKPAPVKPKNPTLKKVKKRQTPTNKKEDIKWLEDINKEFLNPLNESKELSKIIDNLNTNIVKHKEKPDKTELAKDNFDNKKIQDLKQNLLTVAKKNEIISHRVHKNFNSTNKSLGNIIHIGSRSSVNAKKTEAGKYSKSVREIIGKIWNLKHLKYTDLTKWGNLVVRFIINGDGRVSNVEIVMDDAGGVLENYTIEAILEAKLPPIPEKVKTEVGNDKLVVIYEFMVY